MNKVNCLGLKFSCLIIYPANKYEMSLCMYFRTWKLSKGTTKAQTCVLKATSHTVPKLTPDEHTKMKHHMNLRRFFGSQRFCEDSKSRYRCRRNKTRVYMMVYNAFTNGPMFLRWFYYPFQTLGRCEACTTIPDLKISLIMCPPEVNFGTV